MTALTLEINFLVPNGYSGKVAGKAGKENREIVNKIDQHACLRVLLSVCKI